MSLRFCFKDNLVVLYHFNYYNTISYLLRFLSVSIKTSEGKYDGLTFSWQDRRSNDPHSSLGRCHRVGFIVSRTFYVVHLFLGVEDHLPSGKCILRTRSGCMLHCRVKISIGILSHLA